MSNRPVFLARQSYRQRRIMDAVRLLPFLGAALWMVPLVWPTSAIPVETATGSAGPVRMSTALLYIFCIWGGLVCAAFGLWLRSRGTAVVDPLAASPGSLD
ncbi:hypothetical protein Z945_1699 [Sulfitobacter noctilucae]|uniref:hypothetical protein n=1 Tax=Sulfitobacter noctilucae TaxID=1342302 RepID=UPI00056122F1|nr:hypothetical protein [Sulfitobacter noctilucae]KIN60720.1 hypothetical protein Z945_1699 [Sulfitobacter noctilucae]